MAGVIDILSSDDEDEPVQLEVPDSPERISPQLQNVAVEPNGEKDCSGTQSPDPSCEEGHEERECINGSAAAISIGDAQAHDFSPTRGKTRNGVIRSAEPSQSDSLCRQFWQAGNYESHPPKRRRAVQGAMDHVRVHPKFLHSNATSHKWALGAIAELLDNSIDEIQSGATYVRVDKITNPRDGMPALLVQDDGGGMSPDDIRQCMSLGYSQKNNNTTIGQYGNGFKTSTMRLGADVIVLTRNTSDSGFVTQSVGLLSYTFLRKTGHEDIVVPMVDYKLSVDGVKPAAYIRTQMDDWLSNLATITRWSPYRSEDELLKQFDDIGSQGTKVIVYNLWLNDDGILELDFDTNEHDIQLRVGSKEKARRPNLQALLVNEHISNQYRLSLRVYASILYLHMPENFQIILRGEGVEHHNIAMDMKFTQYIVYKPQIGTTKDSTNKDVISGKPNKDASVITTIGFTKEAPMVNVHGFNVYHKNRLIMPFWKVFHDNSSRGRGVVGVLEANFIEPAHDKQDFERTAVFLRLENRLRAMTIEYWNLHCQLIGYKKVSRSKPGPKSNNTNSASLPCPVQRITSSTASPIDAQTPLTTSPTSSGSDDPHVNNYWQENQGMGEEPRNPDVNEHDHPASTSRSGPATPDGVLGDSVAGECIPRTGLGNVKDEVEEGNEPFKRKRLDDLIQQKNSGGAVTLAMQAAGTENGSLLVEVLEQNTILRQKCTDYEKREKHWEQKLMVQEQREQEWELKVIALEKELMEHKLKCVNLVGQMESLIPDTVHVDQGIEYQLQPLDIVKAELEELVEPMVWHS